MRLLRTDKLEMVEFLGQDIPPYAILSHTWGTEEVTFQDIQQGAAQSRRGYGKLAGACNVAMQDGFEFIWIDTCCIDKTSSAELSEAINSMFNWYRNTEVCYALLSDVDAQEDAFALFSNFRESRWFTRGWTLQELIAPGVVYFYDAGWEQIGSRDTLLTPIVEITGINSDCFTAGDLSQFSAAQIMSWAANRNTTRIEDMAYCLLGLFDINMPLLYGEGDRAFARLQEEILRQSEDDTLFFHEEPSLLATSPRWFSGRNNVCRSNSPDVHSRNLYITRSRIVLSFALIRVSRAQFDRECLETVFPWPAGQATCYFIALLNCRDQTGSFPVLILSEQSSGLFEKAGHVSVLIASLAPRLRRGLAVQRVSVLRSSAPTSGKGSWDWGMGNKSVRSITREVIGGRP
ncbi:HET-domain-containing protein [Parathielavia hyrcaniae]|uniref:HET-domain-containing protein n=1 Tax=Parathielavia hyrcaniae TaxID=113614 RepID=A0AAN6PZ07_9PEZI|nr:HET-domain-containing protein [Parathielavia hyrcaniae]